MNIQEDVLQEQISYWKEELAGAPTKLELPTDKPRPAAQSFRAAAEPFELPKDLLKQLKDFSQQEQASLFMTLGSGFMALLHRYTGQDDILVGIPNPGQASGEAKNSLNGIPNTVVLRSQFTENLNFRSLLQQVRERTSRASANSDVPFEQLVGELAPERDPSHAPVVQVMFVLNNALQVSLDRSMAKGLFFNFSYTFSKAIDQGASFENELNPVDYALSRGDSLTYTRRISRESK